MKPRVLLYALVVVLVLLLTWPFFWAVSSSLKDADEIRMRPLRWLPAVPMWSNYVEIWKQVPLARFVSNGIIVTVIAMTGQVLSRTAVAYASRGFGSSVGTYYLRSHWPPCCCLAR